MNIIDELKWRGAINQQTDAEGLYKLVDEKSISLYCGIDPTGDSMHIGHLIPFMILKRFQLAGHHPVILIGGRYRRPQRAHHGACPPDRGTGKA